jgi:hypothetical protein
MHVLWDTIYFCNGKYKGMFPFYETMLVILNFPLRILPGFIGIHEFVSYCLNFSVLNVTEERLQTISANFSQFQNP